MGFFSNIFKSPPPQTPRCGAKFDIKYDKNGKEKSASRCSRPRGHGSTLFGDGHSNSRMT
jgi:hypothetical protein